MRQHHEHDTDDDRLLEMLAEALRPPPAQPTDAERRAFRRAATGTFAEAPRRRFLAPRPVPAFLAAAAAVAVVLVATTAIVRPTMPDSVRAAARTIGLPVDSVELAHTRRSMDAVRSALAGGDAPRLDQATDALSRDLAALGPEDRAAVASAADRLLAEARAAISEAQRREEHDASHATAPTAPPPPSSTTTTATSAPPPTTTAPTPTTTTPTRMGHDAGQMTNVPSGDDHRRPAAETTTTSPPTTSSTVPATVEHAPHRMPGH